MKIAEALALRSDLQNRLEQLKQRLVKNARTQEGDVPAENPIELESELEEVAQQLTSMIQRINRTNAATRFGSQTLADALAERDVLKIRYNAYRELANAASTAQGRTTRSEIKFISTVSVAATQRKADDLAREYRELDTRIQEADWLTVLQDESHLIGREGSWRSGSEHNPTAGKRRAGSARAALVGSTPTRTAYAPYCAQTHGVL